jgi:hypothetical protein
MPTMLTWAKDRMGNGYWLRGQTEHCILAVPGNPIVTLVNQTTLLLHALAGLADAFVFVGYGTAAQGASLTQVDATHWSINSADGLVHDIITLSNGAPGAPERFRVSVKSGARRRDTGARPWNVWCWH